MEQRPKPSEKRRFPRVKEACKFRYRKVDGAGMQGAAMEGVTVNLSGGGVCFTSEEPIDPGQLLAVELGLAEFDSDVVALGKAAWCEGRDDGRYDVGLEFWWMGWANDGAQQAVATYIRKALDH